MVVDKAVMEGRTHTKTNEERIQW